MYFYDEVQYAKKTQKLSEALIRESREPMRRAISAWLELWWTSIPKNAAEQMREIRDLHAPSED